LPPFPTYTITQELAWDDTIAWLLAEDIVDNGAIYADSVNPAFLDAIKPADTGMMGDAENGAALFTRLGCTGCHAVDSPNAGVGPSMVGLAAIAGERVAGLDAATYVRQAIVEPGAYAVEGYAAGVMIAYDALSEGELNDLVAYILSLE
ncbi:MAG: cytochrome c, partial [Anaerolineae bacterium]|nr:cytochrome c [Anaerolineae bacterium]